MFGGFFVRVENVFFTHIFCLCLFYLHVSLCAILLLNPPKLSSTCTLISSQFICKHHCPWRYKFVILVILSNTTETNRRSSGLISGQGAVPPPAHLQCTSVLQPLLLVVYHFNMCLCHSRHPHTTPQFLFLHPVTCFPKIDKTQDLICALSTFSVAQMNTFFEKEKTRIKTWHKFVDLG